MSFFKWVMIVLLKMYAPGKIFGKILSKSYYRFFPICGLYVVCDKGREGGLGMISTRRGKFKPLFLQGDCLPQFLPLVWHPNCPIRKKLKSAWSAFCNDFEKSEREYFLSKQQIYSM